MSQDWQDLLAALEEREAAGMDGAWSAIDIHTLVYALNLVQPFNWPQWSVPPIFDTRPADLSLKDCVRHITRITRQSRFVEGLFEACATEGQLGWLCRRAYELGGGVVPTFTDLDEP
jgi:hypothetical protein